LKERARIGTGISVADEVTTNEKQEVRWSNEGNRLKRRLGGNSVSVPIKIHRKDFLSLEIKTKPFRGSGSLEELMNLTRSVLRRDYSRPSSDLHWQNSNETCTP
jgi:hypothetical protein